MLTEKSFDTGELVINFAEGEKIGKPLVFLHGSTLHWGTWNEWLPTLTKSWHIYAPDLRGHGKSGRAKSGYLYDNFLPDTTALIERHIGEPVVLVGFSLGAAIALGVGAQRPDLVRALILLDPPLSYLCKVGLESFVANEWYTWLTQTLALAHSFEEILARCNQLEPNNDEAATIRRAQMVHNLDPKSVTSVIDNQTYKDYKPQQLLPRLVCPTLLVYGEIPMDSVVNDDDVEFFMLNVARGKTARIKDAGHGVIWGVPGQETLRQMTQFLDSL